MKLPIPISFEWDKGNLEKNWHKHKVHFREAEEVFTNSYLKIFPDPRHSQKEERFVVFGKTNMNRKLTVIFTLRREKIRIISARNQSYRERKEYEKK